MWPLAHAIRKQECGWWVYDVDDVLTTLVSMSFGFAVIKTFIRARYAPLSPASGSLVWAYARHEVAKRVIVGYG